MFARPSRSSSELTPCLILGPALDLERESCSRGLFLLFVEHGEKSRSPAPGRVNVHTPHLDRIFLRRVSSAVIISFSLMRTEGTILARLFGGFK